jgi:DNA repair protein RecO (recombination protein O)
MQRTFRDRAFVLRAYKLGEADRILVMLGEKSGQFRVVAKGIRRTSSKFGARLQSFNLVDVQFYRGRSELATLTQAETISAYSVDIAQSYGSFTNAKLIVEAAQRITEGQDLPSPEQFALLHGALHAMASGTKPPALVAASYLLRLATIEGWQPTLDRCAQCDTQGWYSHFSAGSGGSVCDDCASADALRVDPGALRLMDMLLRADWQAALAQEGEHWGEALDVSGAWVQWQLEQRLRALPFASIVDR